MKQQRRFLLRGGAGNRRRSVVTGQAIVEFALSSLLLMLLVAGLLDLGRVVFMRSLLTNAVREAARTGAVIDFGDSNALTTIRQAAADRSPGLGLTASSSVITITCQSWNGSSWVNRTSCSQAEKHDRLMIQANYTVNLIAARLIRINQFTVHEQAQVVILTGSR